jgi:hypothetical protein
MPEFVAGFRHQLHTDTNAEERFAFADHRVVERLGHARHIFEPALAVGEGADTGKDDMAGGFKRLGVGGDDNGGGGGGVRRGALESLGRRAQIARPVIDDDGGHGPASGVARGR